jgi:hypothetical protein
VKTNDSSNHSKFAQISDVAPQLTAVLAMRVANSPSRGDQPEGSSLEEIVSMPMTLLGSPIRIISGQ